LAGVRLKSALSGLSPLSKQASLTVELAGKTLAPNESSEELLFQFEPTGIDPMRGSRSAVPGGCGEQALGTVFHAKKRYNSGAVEGLNLKRNLVKHRAYGLRIFPAQSVILYQNFEALSETEFSRRFCSRGKLFMAGRFN
jgi:hypothetical protein